MKSEAKLKVKALMSGVVVRGPSGEYGEPGSSEQLEFADGNSEQIIEINYEQAVTFFGQEKADELFKGVEEGGDFND